MWYSIRRHVKDHLILKLTLVVTVLLSMAYLMLQPVQNGLYFLLDDYYYTKGNYDQICTKLRENLQSYIVQNNVRSDDSDAILRWNQKNPSVSLVITDNTYIIYYSYGNLNNQVTTQANSNSYKMQDLVSNHTEISYMTFNTLNYPDGKTLQLSLEYYGHYTYYLWCYYVSLSICFFLFLIPLLLIIRKKTKYIQHLADDLHILEGGDLNYQIEEKGSDEIYQLANGINQMRMAILDKQEQALETESANRRLVTSLSHDLRTPLTSLIGYLEILKQHKYKDNAQLEEFIEKSQDKAYLLKEMSDKLFEYFLVSQKISEEYHMETIAIADLVSGLIDNQIFDLHNQGFEVTTEMKASDFNGFCLMDVEFMQRVLDNILSNIRKHANHNQPVHISGSEENGKFILVFENGVKTDPICSESTGIGLKTCEKIMAEHGGALQTYRNDSTFFIKLIFPYHL